MCITLRYHLTTAPKGIPEKTLQANTLRARICSAGLLSNDTMEYFWETTPLEKMSREQWESLCDGCAKCCMQKLEDEDTREIFYTDVVCRLLDLDSCRCNDYGSRSEVVPACITLTLRELKDPYWLPATCAYRLLAQGDPLPEWHPLLTGDSESAAPVGQSVRGKVIPETRAQDLELHLIDWVV